MQLTTPTGRRLTGAATTAEARVAPWVVAVGWGSVLVFLAASVAAPDLVERYALWPLLVGIVFVGLPHGALDHLVPTRLGFAWARRPTGWTIFLALYMSAAASYGAAWLVAPGWAFAGFLALTVWHWGHGDLRFYEIFLGRRASGRRDEVIAIVTRGSLPIVVPVLAFPAAANDLVQRSSSALGLTAPAWTLADPTLRAVLATGFAVMLTAYLLRSIHHARSATTAAIDLSEVALLLVFFSLVPAYASVGAYFLAWHSLRHLARLLLLRSSDTEAIRNGAAARPIGRLARDLIPITVAAVVVLSAGAYVMRGNLTSVNDFVALYLVLISALTVPHAIVVSMMDRSIQPAPSP